MNLVQEASTSGARASKCVDLLGVSLRSFQRWRLKAKEDARRGPTKIAHKLTESEKVKIIDICNEPGYRNLSPEVIVPRLADKGIYLASERSFYRVLKENRQLVRRGKERIKKKHSGSLSSCSKKS